MTASAVPLWARRSAGLAVLLLSCLLAYRYWFKTELIKAADYPVGPYYEDFQGDWLRLTPAELKSALTSGNPDEWHTLVVRTALGRWRLREKAPEPFNLLMKDYANGHWSAPEREVWEEAFTELDRAWLKARRESQQRGVGQTLPQHFRVRTGPNVVTLQFDGKVDSADVGTEVRFLFQAQPDHFPKSPPAVHWQTDRAPEQTWYRRRLGEWRPGNFESPAAPNQFTVTFDFSWEPAWLATGVRPRLLHVPVPEGQTWKIQGVAFGDSPLLQN